MTSDEARARFAKVWRETNEAYRAMKEAEGALPELYSVYLELDEGERAAVDDLLAETLVSGDESERYDALALIHRFRIVSAVPQLHILEKQLRRTVTGHEPFERRKVLRILGELTSGPR